MQFCSIFQISLLGRGSIPLFTYINQTKKLGGKQMLSLILVVALVVWIVSRLRRKKPLLPIDFFKDSLSRKPFSNDEPPWLFLVFIYGICFIFVTYAGMITYINNYDFNVATINYYRDNISQLEIQISEVDIEIEKILTNSELSEEEANTQIGELTSNKQSLEKQITINNQNLNKLPLNQTPERLKLYKFLLYFG